MIPNIFYFIIFYFLIINSVIGLGYSLSNITQDDRSKNNYGYFGLIGIFTLIIISYITHYFIPHNYIHNVSILFFGLILFIYFYKDLDKKNLLKINALFLILFIAFLSYKTHDDFPYYHFPYTYYLNINNLIIGIGNFNHGFRTPSSIFYLNSLFYLPIIKYHFFQIGSVLIMGFATYNFLNIIENSFKEKNYQQNFFLSLFAFIFVFIFFYRMSEHGTDRSAQILIFLLIIELFFLININHIDVKSLTKILVTLGIIVSLKAFYILYFLFIFPVIYYFIKDKKFSFFYLIFKNFYFYLFILMMINILFINFLNSGCLIYPVYFTCFDNFSWSTPISEVMIMNDWYEQWSKAGANPNFRIENPEIYIQKFNWIGNWFQEYFFTKISDFLLGVTLIIIIFLVLFKSNKKNKIGYKGNFFIYVILLVLFFEWLYNHPSLRYGGYSLISLIIILPFIKSLGQKIYSKQIMLRSLILLSLTIIIFLYRSIDRIIDENLKYQYNPIINAEYRIEKSNFRIQDQFNTIIQKKKECELIEKNCIKEKGEIDIKEQYNYKIFYKVK